VASGLIPAYFVAVNDKVAFVQATATGRTLATIRPPSADGSIVAVSAASDDRTFAIVEAHVNGIEPPTVYLFRLSSSGQPSALSRLPVSLPSGMEWIGFALSPDADKLAVAEGGAYDNVAAIAVYTLATGAVRAWTADGGGGSPFEGAGVLSWTQDERTLSFDWHYPYPGQTRLLSLDASGGNLLTASRPGAALASGGWDCVNTVITPDGKTIACGARRSSASSDADGQAPGFAFAEYDAADGKLDHVLGQNPSDAGFAILLWTNASGSVLIGSVPSQYLYCPIATPSTAGVITGDRFVASPAMPPTVGVITGDRFVALPGLSDDFEFPSITW
jgi:hypothetical protein